MMKQSMYIIMMDKIQQKINYLRMLLLFFISSKMKITIKNMHQNDQDNNKQIIKREKTKQKNQRYCKENKFEKL